MLSSSEIKDRFYSKSGLVDMHGAWVIVKGDIYRYRIQFARLLHYHLINGMSVKDARAELIERGYPEQAAEYAVQQSLDFIKNVLEVDLTQLQREMNSTAAHVSVMVEKLSKAITERFKATTSTPVEYNGKTYDAGASSVQVINSYLAAGACPDYWVTTNNDVVTGWNLESLRGLCNVIAERTALEHALMTAAKARVRELGEAQDYDGLCEMMKEYQ